MPPVPPNSVISGVDYGVTEVNGRPPGTDGDFEGEVSLSLRYSPAGSAVHHEQEIRGQGLVCDGGIFVNEKDDHGKDVRRWRVQHQPKTGMYVARQGLY